jgi:hypothetical protein
MLFDVSNTKLSCGHTEKTTQHAGRRNKERAGANITTTTDPTSENNRLLLHKQGRH